MNTLSARDAEEHLLSRCVFVARNPGASANNRIEANVFRIAAGVVRSRMPRESGRLAQESQAYFAAHPGEQLATAEVVKSGWVTSLPRLRDMLSQKLEWNKRG